MKQKSKVVSEEKLRRYQTDNTEEDRIHFPYEMEDTFMNIISHGDRAAAERMIADVFQTEENDLENVGSAFATILHSQTGIMSHSRMKQSEYAAVLTVSLMARAAIRGGLDPYMAYDMNDLYLQRISEATDEAAHWTLIYDALHGFLDAVEKVHSANNRSIHVLRAKQCIAQHLNKPLTLENVSEAVGISQTYLSAIFQETEGIGFREYIIRQRISASKELLQNTDEDIGVVAAYVGFSSQSHFGKVFRERTGVTPLAYRNGER